MKTKSVAERETSKELIRNIARSFHRDLKFRTDRNFAKEKSGELFLKHH